MTFADLIRMAREQMQRIHEAAPPPANVVDLSAERSKRWLAKYARPMPPKDPPEAA